LMHFYSGKSALKTVRREGGALRRLSGIAHSGGKGIAIKGVGDRRVVL
jgi:hypothetical protein